MKMSVRDIGEIVNRAKQEKERQEHKALFVQAYELLKMMRIKQIDSPMTIMKIL